MRGEIVVTWVVRAIIGVGLLFLAALLVVGGLIAWVAYGLSHHDQAPDAAAYARSVAVRRADAQVAAGFDRQLAQLGQKAPWLRPAGQSVYDSCRPASGSSGAWTMICSRMQTCYYAYAGSASATGRVGALERVLADAGWRGVTVTQRALAADYTIQASAPKAGLLVTWISPATSPAIAQLLADYTVAFGRHPRAGKDGVLQATPPSPGQIMRAAAPPDADLFIVTLQAAYATSPPGS